MTMVLETGSVDDERAATLSPFSRIDERLRAYAAREGHDLSALSTRTWGNLFKAIRIDGDQLAIRLYVARDGEKRSGTPALPRGRADKTAPAATVAAAIREMTDDGLASAVTAFVYACVRQQALIGDKRARGLLERGSKQLAKRFFESKRIPLREFFGLPIQELNQQHQNSLRSHVFRQPMGGLTPKIRLALMARSAFDILEPAYAAAGHRTASERRDGRVDKFAKYPIALLRDIAVLLTHWRVGEFDGLTADQVRRTLTPRHEEPRGGPRAAERRL